MALSKSIMRNVARQFRIRGHGLKSETGLYGRSPDRSARVCNLCENGDYIQDEKHVVFHVSVPNIYGTSSSIYLIIFLKVIQRFCFSTQLRSLQFISAAVDLLIDLFVGTYRLSSHARLEAFVIQIKLNYSPLAIMAIKRAGLMMCCCLRLCTNLCVRLRCGIRVLLIMRF